MHRSSFEWKVCQLLSKMKKRLFEQQSEDRNENIAIIVVDGRD
jgi:hypothetical protein